jgi:hypothetical protein
MTPAQCRAARALLYTYGPDARQRRRAPRPNEEYEAGGATLRQADLEAIQRALFHQWQRCGEQQRELRRSRRRAVDSVLPLRGAVVQHPGAGLTIRLAYPEVARKHHPCSMTSFELSPD